MAVNVQARACPAPGVLLAYVEQMLDDSELRAVAEHVQSCDACEAQLFEASELCGIALRLEHCPLNARDHERILRCQERTLARLRRTPAVDRGDERDPDSSSVT